MKTKTFPIGKRFGKIGIKGMKPMKTTRKICECKKCGHAWLPRATTDKPLICPKCKTARWEIGAKDTKSAD